MPSGYMDGARVRLLLLVVLTAAGAFMGMRANTRAAYSEGTPLAEVAVFEAVPAPEGLAFEATLATPDTTWRKAQTAIGGMVMLAPPMFGGVLGALAHVPELAGVVDGAAPAYGVLDADKRWVIAAHALSSSLAKSSLHGETERVGVIDVVHTKTAWLGLVGAWVLVGSDREAIVKLGPYAFRTLPKRLEPHSALTATAANAALTGPIRAELTRRVAELEKFLLDKDDEQRRAHGARAPDLADPKPLVDATMKYLATYVDLVSSMQKLDVTAEVEDDGLDVRATLTPPPSGPSKQWVDELEGSAALPLATSGVDALVTLYWRSDEPGRESAAKEVGTVLANALGTRLPAQDVTRLGEQLTKIARARAGWAIASVTAGASPGVLLRLSTNDATGIAGSIEAALDLARKPAWAPWEKDALSVTKIARTQGHATFEAGQTSLVQAAWAPRDGELDLAVGFDATAVLGTVTSARTLATDPKVGAWLRNAGSEVAWAMVARPLLLASSPRSDPAFVVLGRSGKAAEVRARVTGVLFRQLVQGQGM